MMKLLVFFLLLLLSSCCSDYVVENHKIAKITTLGSHSYELELSGIRCVSSHDPISILFPSEIETSQYIYFSKRLGELNAENFILTYEKGKTKPLYSIKNIQGTIDIRDQKLDVNLKLPIYNQNSEIEKYVLYNFNGTYEIKNIP